MLTGRRRALLVAAALLAGVFALPSSGGADVVEVPGPAGGPLSSPIPELDDFGDQKSFLLVVEFDGRSVTSSAAFVIPGMARSNEGGPPLLSLQARAADASVLFTPQEWHPQWEESHGGDPGDHTASIRQSGQGAFVVDFHRDVATIDVVDLGIADGLVGTIDIAAAVSEFCLASQSDVDCRIIDLSLDTAAEMSEPLATIGDTVELVVTSELTNPSEIDADTEVSTTIRTPPGLAASPAARTAATTVRAGSGEQIVESYQVTCLSPGLQTIEVRREASLVHPADIDPDMTDNATIETATVDCATVASVDVRTQRIELGKRGVVPITLQSDDAAPFDATWIDASTVRAGSRAIVVRGMGASPAHPGGHLVGRPGALRLQLDMMPVGAMGFDAATTELCVVGSYTPDGGASAYRFVGCTRIIVG